jgi:hypothetical protein
MRRRRRKRAWVTERDPLGRFLLVGCGWRKIEIEKSNYKSQTDRPQKPEEKTHTKHNQAKYHWRDPSQFFLPKTHRLKFPPTKFSLTDLSHSRTAQQNSYISIARFSQMTLKIPQVPFRLRLLFRAPSATSGVPRAKGYLLAKTTSCCRL